MDVELQEGLSHICSQNETDDHVDPLLLPSDTDEAKRLRDEARSTLGEKYPQLAELDVVHILKVIGGVRSFAMTRFAQAEIIDICLSITFPLFMLQCRTLANLLASLSSFDQLIPEIPWPTYEQYILNRLGKGFQWNWRSLFIAVLRCWQREANDSTWLNTRTHDMQTLVHDIQSIFNSVKGASQQITTMTGISFSQMVSNIESTFEFLESGLAECMTKVEELRSREEQSKHLSPFSQVGQDKSWTSGSSIASAGITHRASFGRDNASVAAESVVDSSVPIANLPTKENKWQSAIARIKSGLGYDPDEQQLSRLFELTKSPVVLILTASIPFTIYSTMLCQMPDSLPSLDSNFWSTLGQCVAGFAGLYVVIKPIFSGNDKDKIQTSFPKLFYSMLMLSLLTSIASAVVYAWNPPASIPLAFVSTFTLNIATLLVIQDSGSQIKETNRRNSGLMLEVNDLETELAGYRAGR